MEFTNQIKIATDPIYQKVSKTIPKIELATNAPYLYKINRIKKDKNAVFLTHNYQTPEIFHCVSDIVGDSLKLAYEARDSEADTIIVCGVHFMAETAKILSPKKKV